MSVFGAVVMSHSPDSDSFSSTSQFFLYKYDRRNVRRPLVWKQSTQCSDAEGLTYPVMQRFL